MTGAARLTGSGVFFGLGFVFAGSVRFTGVGVAVALGGSAGRTAGVSVPASSAGVAKVTGVLCSTMKFAVRRILFVLST